MITFGLFWFVYRYNTLYVTKFRFDTGGLLFPKAINQLFTGLYVMELSLIGLFFLVRDVDGTVACEGQAICMIVVMILTVGYQLLLNEAFSPLIRYLPITLEDDAVQRDEEFSRAQRARLGLDGSDDSDEEEEEEEKHRKETAAKLERQAEESEDNHIELKNIKGDSERRGSSQPGDRLAPPPLGPRKTSWADRSSRQRSKYFGAHSTTSLPSVQRMRENMAEDIENQGPLATTNARHKPSLRESKTNWRT